LHGESSSIGCIEAFHGQTSIVCLKRQINFGSNFCLRPTF